MRQIKFRGRDVDTGRMVYGCFIVGRCGEPCIATNRTAAYEVEPNSVAQFVGHDSNGNEVYEGDKLTDSQGNTYIAKFDSVVERQSNRTPAFRRAPFDFTKEFIELTVEAAS